ncbi:E3 ubiquitin-protein ligase RNFT1 isoform X3 [Egretta garzetta]|uniref:E3 ubiquitin-protein ligase RNFT1 isoform X3 n=1 Tax=Egretta garzetta TaxID=188379 RepID=UPI00163CECB4|nr:E3 ubiquitin-protein ligase RNFT1 isoform X3 [Egretta garzetta]
MQPNCSHLHNIQGSGDDSSSSQNAHAARLSGESSCHHSGDVRIQLNSAVGEARENASSLHSRPGSQSHSHGHAHGEAGGLDNSTPDSEEHSGSSLSELRYLLQWLHKSLPYILILCVKLIMQHIIGISLGIGLLTTYMYANKSIVNQVFLRDRCSKLQCAWLLLYLTGSSLLFYYAFHSQSLYYSLIFLNPTVDFMNIWEVLWIVVVTDFILKFLFMGFKCFILLVPSFMMSFKSKEYWLGALNELFSCTCYGNGLRLRSKDHCYCRSPRIRHRSDCYQILRKRACKNKAFELFWTIEKLQAGLTDLLYATTLWGGS